MTQTTPEAIEQQGATYDPNKLAHRVCVECWPGSCRPGYTGPRPVIALCGAPVSGDPCSHEADCIVCDDLDGLGECDKCGAEWGY